MCPPRDADEWGLPEGAEDDAETDGVNAVPDKSFDG